MIRFGKTAGQGNHGVFTPPKSRIKSRSNHANHGLRKPAGQEITESNHARDCVKSRNHTPLYGVWVRGDQAPLNEGNQ